MPAVRRDTLVEDSGLRSEQAGKAGLEGLLELVAATIPSLEGLENRPLQTVAERVRRIALAPQPPELGRVLLIRLLGHQLQ